MGIGQDGKSTGSRSRQRADFFEVEVGLETTLKRPLINTRDEPHADPELYRRLHVIIGDANLSEFATYLKLGTTSLVLSMVEQQWDFSSLALSRPVRRVARGVARPGAALRDRVGRRPADDSRADAGGVRRAGAQVRRRPLRDARPTPPRSRSSTSGRPASTPCDAILTNWSTSLDWIAKKALLDGYRRRDGLEYPDSRLDLVDLQFADVEPKRGLWARLEQRGRLRRMTTDEQVARAIVHAPESTRAYFRGECLRRYPRTCHRGQLGLGHLRPPGADRAAAGSDAGSAAWHQGSRAVPARHQPHGRRPHRIAAGTLTSHTSEPPDPNG